jgi:sugar phosphate isomerase/epimerase
MAIYRDESLFFQVTSIMNNPILISTAAYDGYDLATAFNEIAAAGVDLVEIAFIEGYTYPFSEDDFNASNADRILGLMADCNLRCRSFSAHMDLSRETAVGIFTRRMEFAKMIGAQYIISNAGPMKLKKQFMKNIEAMGRTAASMGIVIVLENPGDGKSSIIDSAEPAAAVIEEIASDSVRLNYDFGNLLSHCFEKLRPETDYRHALAQTAHFHIKDVVSNQQGWHFTEIGKGEINYRKVLQEVSADPRPIPLSLEIPLRVRRAPDAAPLRAASPVDLKEISRVISGSLKFVKEMLSNR